MNQKGFVNIILIVVAIVVIGGVGYFALVKKSDEVTSDLATCELEKTEIERYRCYSAVASLNNDVSICEAIPDLNATTEQIKIECYGGVAYGFGKGQLSVCNTLNGIRKFSSLNQRQSCLQEVAVRCCQYWQLVIRDPNPEPKVCKNLRQHLSVDEGEGFCAYWQP